VYLAVFGLIPTLGWWDLAKNDGFVLIFKLEPLGGQIFGSQAHQQTHHNTLCHVWTWWYFLKPIFPWSQGGPLPILGLWWM